MGKIVLVNAAKQNKKHYFVSVRNLGNQDYNKCEQAGKYKCDGKRFNYFFHQSPGCNV
jgi:hypothetical protein